MRRSKSSGRLSTHARVTRRSTLRRSASRSVTRAIDAEQPVAADGQREQLGVGRPAARHERAGVIDEIERFDVGDHRPHPQPAPVDVRRQRPADRQLIRAGLLLHDPPLPLLARAGPQQVIDQARPVDAGLDRHEAALGVQIDHAAQRRHVEEHRAGAELLSAHRVTPARDADRQPPRNGAAHRLLQRPDRPDLHHLLHGRAIELRVNVVDLTRVSGNLREVRPRRNQGCLRLRGAKHHATHDTARTAEKS